MSETVQTPEPLVHLEVHESLDQRITAIESRLSARCLPEKGSGKSAIGAVLRERRKAVGLTLRAVKQRGGPSMPFQCDIENGKQSNVTVVKLLAWCAAIGCDPVQVFQDIVEAMQTEGSGT